MTQAQAVEQAVKVLKQRAALIALEDRLIKAIIARTTGSK